MRALKHRIHLTRLEISEGLAMIGLANGMFKFPANWRYALRSDGSRIEQAVWSARFSPSMAAHFHNEMQITVVLAGRRRFLTQNGLVVVDAGETAIFPPKMPHEPLGPDANDTFSVNLYLVSRHESPIQRQSAIVRTPSWLDLDNAVDQSALNDWTMDELIRSPSSHAGGEADLLIDTLMLHHLAVSHVAEMQGMSREGFIRCFRRAVGMTPHAYRLAHRLNHARTMLARDVRAAVAAADAGFADQSHLGRNFLRAFGTTPDAYRRSLRN